MVTRTVKVHILIETRSHTATRRGIIAARCTDTDSEADTINGNRIEILGGINKRVTCDTCLKVQLALQKQRGFISHDVVPFIFYGLAIAAVCVWLGYAIVEDSRQWAEFRQAHKCRIVGEMSGNVFTTVSADGKAGVGSTPGKTGWLCDDGVTYWR